MFLWVTLNESLEAIVGVQLLISISTCFACSKLVTTEGGWIFCEITIFLIFFLRLKSNNILKSLHFWSWSTLSIFWVDLLLKGFWFSKIYILGIYLLAWTLWLWFSYGVVVPPNFLSGEILFSFWVSLMVSKMPSWSFF